MNNKPEIKIAITGHRPNKLGGYDEQKNKKNTVIDVFTNAFKTIQLKYDIKYVLIGMALGTDQWVAEACMKLNIPFIACIPFFDYEKKWPRKSKIKYNILLGFAQQKIFVSSGGYDNFKLFERNKYMVDNSDLLLAIWDGSSGGTSHAINYAKWRNKKHFNLYENVKKNDSTNLEFLKW